jgi:hypothetical protein
LRNHVVGVDATYAMPTSTAICLASTSISVKILVDKEVAILDLVWVGFVAIKCEQKYKNALLAILVMGGTPG